VGVYQCCLVSVCDCYPNESIATEWYWAEMTDPMGRSSRPPLIGWRTGPDRSVME